MMRRRIPILLVLCLSLATLSGCIGQTPGADSGVDTETTSPTTSAKTATTETYTTREAPTKTFSDAKAHDVVDDIRAKQQNISTFHAVKVKKRIYHLPNGNSYIRSKKIDITKKFVDGTMLRRREFPALHHQVYIENRTSRIGYNRTTNTYDVGIRHTDGPSHYFVNGVYDAKDEFKTAFEHDVLSYHGKTHVLGHDVYVIEFDNQWKNPDDARWYNATFWFDTKTRALVMSKCDYPMPIEHTLSGLKNGDHRTERPPRMQSWCTTRRPSSSTVTSR